MGAVGRVPDPDALRTRELTLMERVIDAALEHPALDDLLDELLERIAEILAADTAAFLLLERSTGELVARAAKGIEEEVEQGVRIPVGRGFAGRIAAERAPVAIEDVDHAEILNPILRQKGIRSLLGVPLLVDGEVIGVLHVGTLVPRIFSETDRRLLQLAADRAALAIERARLYEQRRVVEAMQRALLPDAVPEIPGVEIAVRYRPADVGQTIGGDWYDAFELGDGRITLVIGDVMGHGVEAAALMAQLRTALRAYAFDGQPPAAVADRLNQIVLAVRPATMTTLCHAVLEPVSQTLTMVSAGHVPPLLLESNGETTLLPVVGDPPLGVVRTAEYREHRFPMALDSTLLLVTDGAVEVPGEPLDAGLERLAELARREPDLRRLCSAVVDGEALNRRLADDVAVLAARLVPLPDRLRRTWPADSSTLRAVRHVLRRWLAKWSVDDDTAYDITVAVQEACTNAVDHAYGPGTGEYEVDAAYDDGAIVISVRDNGSWRESRGSHRGRGLPIMRALMDSVEIERNGGTTVVLRRVPNPGAPQ
jgi:serine phosphatase RsbU (regulator of sigma subunit)/anti-sigma regulatory factor (Ser/Thr protein kinase)